MPPVAGKPVPAAVAVTTTVAPGDGLIALPEVVAAELDAVDTTATVGGADVAAGR
jgi:hypothetical protein